MQPCPGFDDHTSVFLVPLHWPLPGPSLFPTQTFAFHIRDTGSSYAKVKRNQEENPTMNC